MRELRPYQAEAIQAIRQSLGSGHKRPVLQLPTGGGKTAISGAVIRMARSKGTRVMFVVPAISLIDQTVESFRKDGLTDIGVIQADHWMTDPAKPIQVCSIQSLSRRDLPENIGLVIVDEAHRSFKFLNEWLSAWPSVPFIGLSATPWAKGMAKHWDDLIIASSTQEMIDAGYLSQFVVYAPGHPDLSQVKIERGDYREDQLGEAMDKAPLIADIVRTWKQYGENEPTLLFAVNRLHAKHCQQEFIENGVTAAYIDANTDAEERRIIAAAFHRGDYKVVCNVGCLTTGVDWDVRCIVLARPTRSEMLFVQMIGRGLRTAEGKNRCIILDHSDTHQTLGFVTDIHYEELDDGKKTKDAKKKSEQPLPKECARCHYLRPAKVHACPACGYKPEKQNEIEHVDGELIEVTAKAKADKATKQRWYSGLMGYAKFKGYSDGWAAHTYKEKFGVWPRGLSDVRTSAPDDVVSFITHLNIKKAKSRKASIVARDRCLNELDRMFKK